MKKLLSFVLALVLVVGAAAVVSASEPGKLLIWADEVRSKVLQEVKADFEAEYGIPVEIQELAFGDIRDTMGQKAPTGEGPDILIGGHDWLGQLVTDGLISPIDLTGKKDQFYNVALDAFSWGGEVYAVPYAIESIGLFYNKDLVPVPPTTIEEFEDIIADLTNANDETYGFVMPQPDPYHTFPFLSATGGYVFGMDSAGTLNPLDIGLNTKGAVRGLQILDDLYAADLVPYTDYNTMMSLFKNNQVGMMITGPWAFADLRAAGVNYGFTKIPNIDGQAPKPFVGVQGFMISSFSENEMLAQAFLTEFVAQKEVMLNLFELDNRPPAFIAAAEVVKEDEDIAGVLASASLGIPMPSIPEMNSVWTAWSNALEVVLTQKEDVKPALGNAVEQIYNTMLGN